jgi:hypothetical protein
MGMEVTTTNGQGSPAADKMRDAVRRATSCRLPRQLKQILSLNDLDLAGSSRHHHDSTVRRRQYAQHRQHRGSARRRVVLHPVEQSLLGSAASLGRSRKSGVARRHDELLHHRVQHRIHPSDRVHRAGDRVVSLCPNFLVRWVSCCWFARSAFTIAALTFWSPPYSSR